MRLLLALATISAAAISQAGTILTLDTNDFQFDPTHTNIVTVTGTIDNTTGTKAVRFFGGDVVTTHNLTYQSSLGDTEAGFLAHDGPVEVGQTWHGKLFLYFGIAAEPHPGDFAFAEFKPVLIDASGFDVPNIGQGNYRITAVPEPSAFAALGLGALAIVRRRRR